MLKLVRRRRHREGKLSALENVLQLPASTEQQRVFDQALESARRVGIEEHQLQAPLEKQQQKVVALYASLAVQEDEA
jgi:hypothetical protein